MSKPRVAILMATYNGEAFLSEQIDSLLQQDFRDWQLLVSDDGSTDGTMRLLEAIADDRLEVLPARQGRPGHVANFEYLLAEAKRRGCDYFFLADQDDFWEPGKLSALLPRLAQEQPTLVHSDLELISEHGKSLGGFRARSNPALEDSVQSLLRENHVVGCSAGGNQSLLSLALPFPPGLANHDWWLALCAASEGQLRSLDERLVRYRQHGGNTIGQPGIARGARRLPHTLRRQRQVFDSKRVAIAELVQRLRERGRTPPPELDDWIDTFANAEGLDLARRLAFSEHRPPSRALLVVQLLALGLLTPG